MTEVSLSMVAWISVVLIQAIVHFAILGPRRDRQRQDEEDVLLEGSLGLSSSNEGAAKEAYDDATAVSYPDISLYGDGSDIIKSNVTRRLQEEKFLDGDEPSNFIHLLSQTGSEMMKSRSFERLVQEQIRARAQ